MNTKWLNARVTHLMVGGLIATASLTLVPVVAQAGQPCEAKSMTLMEMERGLELAVNTAQALDQAKVKVAIIARVGQNLREWGQRYSHIGLVYQPDQAHSTRGPAKRAAWRVVHKLNECGSEKAHLYRQGLADFFSDGLYEWEAAIVPLAPDLAGKVLALLNDKPAIPRMHERAYNMLAYPWSIRYQQSNQWVIETLASSAEPAIRQRSQAQAWLKFKGFQPDRLKISAFKRLGARVTRANVAFDDHPNALRFSSRIDTTTADSVLRWLRNSQLGQTKITVR
ncbi:MAG: DUF2145 domain-containing protein [Burkholderiaceae bacterium]